MRGRTRRRRATATALAAAGVAASLASLAASRGGAVPEPGGGEAGSAPAAASLPAPPAPAFTVPAPKRLAASRHESTWAPVERATLARAAPSARAAVVARLSARTPEGTTNLVLALASSVAADGSLWIRVSLPVRPAGTTGWVRRSTLGGYGLVRTHLVIDLSDRRAVLTHSGKQVFSAPVGVGLSASPTPTGRFYVRNKLTRYASPFYGPIAFGTSAASSLSDWPGGGFVGIHGTNRPDLIPGAVSHGCIRLRNADILRLARLMGVGTPVTVRP